MYRNYPRNRGNPLLAHFIAIALVVTVAGCGGTNHVPPGPRPARLGTLSNAQAVTSFTGRCTPLTLVDDMTIPNYHYEIDCSPGSSVVLNVDSDMAFNGFSAASGDPLATCGGEQWHLWEGYDSQRLFKTNILDTLSLPRPIVAAAMVAKGPSRKRRSPSPTTLRRAALRISDASKFP